MSMRFPPSGNSDMWGYSSVSFYYSSQVTSTARSHSAAPSMFQSDPWDIDSDFPFPSTLPAKNLSRTNIVPSGNKSDIDNTLLNLVELLLQIINKLLSQDKNDAVPPAEDRGKGGGCDSHPGSRDRFNDYGKESSVDSNPITKSFKGKSYTDGNENSRDDNTTDTNDRSRNVNSNNETRSEESGQTSKASGPSSMPEPTGTVTVNETIVVKAGEVFDGGGKLYKAGSNLGDGGQSEGQKPIFKIEPGGVVKNLQYEGADGIHTMGDATIQNVWVRDVGEDALTMKKPGNVTWSGGGAFNASDKIFQLNAGGSFTLENFTADNFGKAIRTNGGKNFDLDITVRNSNFTNGKEAIVRTDATDATITLDGVTFSNVPNDVLAPDGTKVVGAVKRGSK